MGSIKVNGVWGKVLLMKEIKQAEACTPNVEKSEFASCV